MIYTQHTATYSTPVEKDEYWYGGCVTDGLSMPYGQQSLFSRDLTDNPTVNQAAPLLVSSAGRYIWSENGFSFSFADGLLTVEASDEIVVGDGFGTLREAYQAAARRFFPASGAMPPDLFFTAPQYNTWIELLYDQNQAAILEYAQNILANGFPPGVLMIDAGWAEHFGKFVFHSGRFPDPAGTVKRLHDLGFRVMLWECPFVTADTPIFRYLAAEGLLVRDPSGEPAIKHWWDGYSAVLDMTNPAAIRWLTEQNAALMETYGIDGFKFDAGDACYYATTDVTCEPVTPNEQCERWARFGLNYAYNEYRACFKCGGQALVQRLADKCHSWGADGLAALVPHMLAQGLLGYAFGCPDMIGGGEYLNFQKNSDHLDQELVVRYAQCAALMPMMQFSAAPWRILDSEPLRRCREAAQLHMTYGETIRQLAQRAAETGEPIVRCLEYTDPHQGWAAVTDEFLLGDDILVAPVLQKGVTARTVAFPTGRWRDASGQVIQGPARREVPVTADTLPIYTREDHKRL